MLLCTRRNFVGYFQASGLLLNPADKADPDLGSLGIGIVTCPQLKTLESGSKHLQLPSDMCLEKYLIDQLVGNDHMRSCGMLVCLNYSMVTVMRRFLSSQHRLNFRSPYSARTAPFPNRDNVDMAHENSALR